MHALCQFVFRDYINHTYYMKNWTGPIIIRRKLSITKIKVKSLKIKCSLRGDT